MNQLPNARTREIMEQELASELLIYDLQTNTAYSLNETSKIVYQACAAKSSFDELKRKHKYTDDLISFALDELNAKNLLEDYSANNFAGMNRREVIKKVGLASMVALPVIASIVAPKAANAASSGLLANGQACSTSNQAACQSGACSGTKNTCCNRNGPNGTGTVADNATCTTTTDCCLSTTTSRCQNGRCCRNTGINCGTDNSICCSGVCSNSACT